jgi:hypothetical protein
MISHFLSWNSQSTCFNAPLFTDLPLNHFSSRISNHQSTEIEIRAFFHCLPTNPYSDEIPNVIIPIISAFGYSHSFESLEDNGSFSTTSSCRNYPENQHHLTPFTALQLRMDTILACCQTIVPHIQNCLSLFTGIPSSVAANFNFKHSDWLISQLHRQHKQNIATLLLQLLCSWLFFSLLAFFLPKNQISFIEN